MLTGRRPAEEGQFSERHGCPCSNTRPPRLCWPMPRSPPAAVRRLPPTPGGLPATLPAAVLPRSSSTSWPGSSCRASSATCSARPPSPSPTRPAATASPCSTSSAPAAGTTRPSWPNCAGTWPRSWPTPTPCWSWTPAASPSRGPTPAAWPGSGAAGWARSTTARSASSWPT